jgi:hypothetical protein
MIGSCRLITSPPTLAPERIVTVRLKEMTSSPTLPETVTGASKATTASSTVPSIVAEPWNTTTVSTVSPSTTRAAPSSTTREFRSSS